MWGELQPDGAMYMIEDEPGNNLLRCQVLASEEAFIDARRNALSPTEHTIEVLRARCAGDIALCLNICPLGAHINV